MEQEAATKYQTKLEEKKKTSQEQGVTLISIPYWWDCQKESLMATISAAVPNVLPKSTGYSQLTSLRETGFPIPLIPPPQL
jgi:hypothetical protein